MNNRRQFLKSAVMTTAIAVASPVIPDAIAEVPKALPATLPAGAIEKVTFSFLQSVSDPFLPQVGDRISVQSPLGDYVATVTGHERAATPSEYSLPHGMWLVKVTATGYR